MVIALLLAAVFTQAPVAQPSAIRSASSDVAGTSASREVKADIVDPAAIPEFIGPCERCDFRLFSDLRSFPKDFYGDVKSVVNFQSAALMGIGGGISGISAANWDADVASDTMKHGRRWGGANNSLDVAGHPATHLGVTSAIYAASLISDDARAHEFSRAAIHALLLTDASVLALKVLFDSERPNGEGYGFPSGHTASSFALAAVIEEQHGRIAGLTAYTAAGLVGWHRIDDRKHDLSDVLFGAALGLAIGKSVGRNHLLGAANCQLAPYMDEPTRQTGILFSRKY